MGRIRLGTYSKEGSTFVILGVNGKTVDWKWSNHDQIKKHVYTSDEWDYDKLTKSGWKHTPNKCVTL